MEPAGLTSLPIEVIHHISCYLSVQDVLSCSLTCHDLRNVLNDNVVWRKYLPCDLSGLEIQEQRLTPALNIDESLSQLCESRQQFVRKTQVMNNWRQGHCVQYKSTYKDPKLLFYRRIMGDRNGDGSMIYDDKYFFRVHSLFGDIEVWDITETPVLHTIWKTVHDEYFVVGSYLVGVIFNIVNVYRINLPETDLPIIFSFSIFDENVTFNEHIDINGLSFNIFGHCLHWNHATVNNYLISSQSGNFKSIYIWDIHSASKVGCFEPPIECFNISFNSFFGKNIFFEILGHNSDSNVKYLSVFDIEKFQFTAKYKFKFSSNSYISMFEDYVITLDNRHPGTVCSIFDFNSSLKLKERRFDNSFIIKNNALCSVTIVNGRFVVLCNDGFHIVDALTLETVDMFKEDNESIITKQMVLFQSYVVIACDKNNQLELWDVNRKNKLPVNLNEKYTNLLYLDKFSTKLVIINDEYVSVVHFW